MACAVPSCDRLAHARTWCKVHYERWRRTGNEPPDRPVGVSPPSKICIYEDCDRPSKSIMGLCASHYAQYRRNQSTENLASLQYHNPRGTGSKSKDGYVQVSRNGKTYFEHRLIMEEMLGRSLFPNENVHHKNGLRRDNRPSNLELWTSSQPSGQRVTDLLAWAHEIIERYETEIGDL